VIEMPWTVRRRRRGRAIRLIADSGLFDPSWFAARAGPRRSGNDLLESFVDLGWHGKVDPHPCFWMDHYRSNFPGKSGSCPNPLAHYVEEGWRRGLWPNPVFNPTVYLENNPDLKELPVEPLRHYLEHGWKEGRPFHPSFEVEEYQKMFPMVPVGMSPLEHFLRDGWRTPSRRSRKSGMGGMFDEWMIAIAKWRQGSEAADTLRALRGRLELYQEMERRSMEFAECPPVHFSISNGTGRCVLETVNALTRQIGEMGGIVIDKDVRFLKEDVRRLRILSARRPECTTVIRKLPFGERSGMGDGIQIFLEAGICPMPETTVSLVGAYRAGDLENSDLDGLFTGEGKVLVVFNGSSGLKGGSGRTARRTIEARNNSCPLPFREYFSHRDPAFWTLHDFFSGSGIARDFGNQLGKGLGL